MICKDVHGKETQRKALLHEIPPHGLGVFWVVSVRLRRHYVRYMYRVSTESIRFLSGWTCTGKLELLGK